MDKIIEIDIIEKNDLLEKYNRKKVNQDLIDYIIKSALEFNRKDKIKIVINNKLNIDSINFIKEGLKIEYNNSLKKHSTNNIIQAIYLVIGVISLFISTMIKVEVIRELILIGSWVFIWSMLEIEMFSDMEGRKRRRMIKNILKGDIIEKKI